LARHVGDDPASVLANRRGLTADLGVTELVFSAPVHSNTVGYVHEVAADVEGVDALITDQPDLAVAALGADCVILALATADGWVAAVHCGWKGLVADVVGATLRALGERGAQLRDARAHLGPAICGTCYAVDEQRAEQVRAVLPAAVVTTPAGFGVDVRAGVLDQLAGAGVLATWDARCTAEDPNLFSFRRDGVTGRQAIAIVSRPR
jgi:YfiH family protein